jgi:hypothetical protein
MRARLFCCVALALAACGDDPAPRAVPDAAPARSADAASLPRADCSSRSEAGFPGAFTDPSNLVVGPFVLVGGGELTLPSVVREYGGNKFPALVKRGDQVTVRVRQPGTRLAYGPLPEGEITLDEAHRAVVFEACRKGTEYTFWSGFVLARKPMCVRLTVHARGERKARQAELPLGRPC